MDEKYNPKVEKHFDKIIKSIRTSARALNDDDAYDDYAF